MVDDVTVKVSSHPSGYCRRWRWDALAAIGEDERQEERA
jgi:hypothetical protein